MRSKNICLENQLDAYEEISIVQEENIEFWKNKYEELVERLKEDIKPQIAVFADGLNKHIEGKSLCMFEEYDNEKYEYYKEVFNLKEEGLVEKVKG